MLMLGLTVQPFTAASVVHAANPPAGGIINGDYQGAPQHPLVIGSTPYAAPVLDTTNGNSPYVDQVGLTNTDPAMGSGDCNLTTWDPNTQTGPAAGNYSNPAWWSYTAPTTGSITADTFGSNYDTAIGIYSATNPAQASDFTQVGCNDNVNGQESSLIHIPVVVGVTYYFMVVAATADNSQSPTEWGGNLQFHVHSGTLAAFPVNQTAVEGHEMLNKPIATFVDTDKGSCAQYSATVTIEGSPQTVSCLSPTPDLSMSCVASTIDTVCTVYATHTYLEEQFDNLTVVFNDLDGDTLTLGPGTFNAPLITVADAQLTHVQNGTGADGLSQPQPAVEGTPVSVYLGTFTDTAGISPDGSVVYCDITGFSAKVDWGDGNDNGPVNNLETITSAGPAGDSIVPSTHHPGPCTFDVYGTHTYISTDNAAPLPHAIKLTVFDAGLGFPCIAASCTPSVNLSANALVSDAPANGVAATAQFPALEGQQFATPVLLGTVTDTDPLCPAENLDITVNWGDGSTVDTVTVPNPGAANGSITYTKPAILANPCTYQIFGLHTYAEENAKAYAITVSGDILGGAKWSFGTTALVGDSALNYTTGPSPLTNIADPIEGKAFTGLYLGTFHDAALNLLSTPPDMPPTSCDIKDYTVVVNWGDGAVPPSNPTTLTAANGGIKPSTDGNPCDFDLFGSYTYKEAGTYTITITTTDAGGAAAIVGTDKVTVDEAALTSVDATDSNWIEGQLLPGGTIPFQHLGDFHDTDPFCMVSDYSVVPVTVNWGDGITDNLASVLSLGGNCDFQVTGHHVYAESGNYTVVVTVTDGVAPGGGPSTVVLTSTAHVADAPLSQTTVGSDKGTESTVATFNLGTFTDADCPLVGPSSDPADFTPANVSVNWGDSSPNSAAAAVTPGPNCTYTVTGTHQYLEEGNFTTSFTVIDTGVGGSSTQVAGKIVIADATLDQQQGFGFAAVEGQPIPVKVLGQFHDNDANCAATDYSATIAWGDGTTSTASAPDTIVGVAPVGSCIFNILGGHTYKSEGKFTVNFTVNDHGATTTFSMVIDVSGPAGDATLTAIQQGQSFTGIEGASNANVYLGAFHDNDPNCKASDYTATINWGDGSTSNATSFNGGIVDTNDGFCDFKLFGSHTYTEEGSYTLTSSVQDKGGAPAITLADSAIISDAALSSAKLLIPFTAIEGTNTGTINLGTVTDANPNCTPNDLTVLINWGDGTATDTTTGQVSQIGTSCVFNVTGNHAFAEETTTPNNVVVTVNDVGGSTTSFADQATVTDNTLTSVKQDNNVASTNCPVIPPGSGIAPICEGNAVGLPLAEPPSGVLLGTITDNDPNCVLTDYTVTIKWGETPYTDTTTGYLVKTTGCSYNVYGYHTFPEEGSFNVVVTVTDQGGSVTTITDAFVINDAQLTGTNNNFTAVQGMPVTHQLLGTFIDANTPGCIEAILDFHVVSINWNDQTGTDTNTGTIVPDPAGGCKFDVYGSHTTAAGFLLPFDFVGTFPVTVKVVDDGGSMLTLTPTVTVGDAALNAGPGATVNAIENIAFSNQLLGNFHDTDPGCMLTDFSIGSVVWGDGATNTNATITQDLNTCNFHIFGGHTYVEEGTYHPVITVNDSHGASIQITGTVVVADAPLTAQTNPISQSCTLLTACNNVIVATFTDTNSNCNNEPNVGATYTADINWGDTTAHSAGTAVQRGTSCVFDIIGSHTFTSTGPKTILVVITDDGGATVTTNNGVPETAEIIVDGVPPSSPHSGTPGVPNYTKDYFRVPVNIALPARYFIDLLVNQYAGGLFTGHLTYTDKAAGIAIPFCTLQTNPPGIPPCKLTILSYVGNLVGTKSSTIWATWQLKGNPVVHFVRIDSTAPASGADTIKVTTGSGLGLAVPVTSSPPVTPTFGVKIG